MLERRKREAGPYRCFDVFIHRIQGVCALERSDPGSDEEILILYRMSLQLYGAGEVNGLDAEMVTPAEDGVRGVKKGGGGEGGAYFPYRHAVSCERSR